MYLSLAKVFEYLKASPSSRCFIEGEAIVNAQHLVMCGIKEVVNETWTINALCVQSSGVKSDPHEISGVLKVTEFVDIESFTCTCKAGASGSCKHVSATLIFCTRKPMEDLDKLSCTDTECVWKTEKPQVQKSYEAKPLHETDCFKTAMCREPIVRLTEDDIKSVFNEAMKAMPDSEFSSILKGRKHDGTQILLTPNPVDIPEYVGIILQNAKKSQFLNNLNLMPDVLNGCCDNVLKSLECGNIQEAMCCEQGTQEWRLYRNKRITGSTCYSIYTFSKTDWSTKLQNFFHPKDIKTKEMRHGLEQETLALNVFKKNNPKCNVQKIGIYVSERFPWLAYSPDGVIFVEDMPKKLLEIKCPYLGKIKSGEEIIPTLPYLNKRDHSLKENHAYYAQIQLGMALLNLSHCDFIVYFSQENSYLHITVPFNRSYAEELIRTISKKYFSNMIHYVCQSKIADSRE